MHRPDFRQPSPGGMGSRGGGFRSPTGFDNSAVGMHPSPPWGFRGGPPPSFGPPRFGQFDSASPNTPPRDFGGNGNRGYHGGSGGKGRCNNGSSPAYTPRRQNPSPRGASYRNSPYNSQSPGQHMGYQGSPRHSTPFGSRGGRGQGAQGGVEKFYNASMLQDPWASLQPVPVTSTTSSQQQTTHTGRPGRYFN
ncbi:M-phase-specific PLK1-interacting protein [Salvelinus fontinalis]|uniref:M-phase-specific PLK1-interacting protein n=1 Tax=Salvelinus fontinalis TaxID=8038 RepID=UPI002484E3EC|nr:M-phase-specific PLK1-interacting protein [Salvelinus fontinalis]